jgi:hypothetical protein
MKFQDIARFEFRVFADDLAQFRDAFAALGWGTEQPPSRETYIVTRLNVESNVKIRAHCLEVKGLQGRLQLLEQWQPVLKSAFPVTADDVENAVAPALGIDVDLRDAPPFTEGALVAFAAEQPALKAVVVDKRRTLFDLGDCEAEFTELGIDPDRLQTVAIEAAEAHPADALLRRVGLEAARNESYSLFLQRRLFQGPR